MKKIHKNDLKKFNGKNGTPSYISYQGKVYDVSNSGYWKKGKHHALHRAGEDLTETIRAAHHNDDLLERVPLMGELI